MMQGRSTRQKRAVESMLRETREFVSARALHQGLVDRGEDVSLATIYRALQTWHAAGLLDTLLPPGHAEHQYRLCHHGAHHHHAVCRVCGTVQEFTAWTLRKQLTERARDLGFTELDVTMEVFGICARCRGSGSRL